MYPEKYWKSYFGAFLGPLQGLSILGYFIILEKQWANDPKFCAHITNIDLLHLEKNISIAAMSKEHSAVPLWHVR
jgi:hypothetical protein